MGPGHYGEVSDLPQGFGAFAGVPSSTKSDEITRWTRTGVSLLDIGCLRWRDIDEQLCQIIGP
jgi:hypothetical protein